MLCLRACERVCVCVCGGVCESEKERERERKRESERERCDCVVCVFGVSCETCLPPRECMWLIQICHITHSFSYVRFCGVVRVVAVRCCSELLQSADAVRG